MSPEEVLDTYISLKLHFTQDRYDYFTYQGKVKKRNKSYEERHDKGQIFLLSRRYRKDDFIGLVISNLLKDEKVWPGQLLSSEANDIYKEWLKFNDSLTYNVVQEMKTLKQDHSLSDLIKVSGGQHPLLLKEYYAGNVHLETLIVVTSILKIMPSWTDKITDNFIWPTTKRLMIKYAPFIKADNKKLTREIYGVFKNGVEP